MRLRTRLFIAFSLFAGLLLVGLALLFQLGFERGLDRYLGQRQQQQLEALAEEFSEFHERRGSFRGIRLRLMMRDHEAALGEAPMPPGLGLQLADGVWVFGPPVAPEERIDAAIRVAGELVGWLTLPASDPLRMQLENRFQQRQIRTLLWSLLPAVLLAMLASWLISRQIGRPIEQTARFAGTLAKGQYHERLALQGDDETGQLAHKLNQLALALELATRARERWLADISHELRTPMAVLKGELEALVDGIRPVTGDTLAALQHQTDHINKLLDDLHDLALADLGTLRYQFMGLDLGALLTQSCESFSSLAQRNGHRLAWQIPAHPVRISGDTTRLRQLIDNLLDNAIKYTEAPGQIETHLQIVDQQAVVTVEDTPPRPQSPEDGSLFDPFVRHHDDREQRGSGLGLAICKRIAEAHGGELQAHASSLGGLRMVLSLPLSREDEDEH